MDNLPVKDIERQAEKAKRTYLKERYQGGMKESKDSKAKSPKSNPRPEGKSYDVGGYNK